MYLMGPALAALGAGLVIQRYVNPRAVFTVVSGGLVAYSLLAGGISPVDHDASGLVAAGIVLMLAAIALVAFNFRVVTWVVEHTLGRVHGIVPVARVAVSHPDSRPVRTAFTLGMFALVMFSVTSATLVLSITESDMGLGDRAPGFHAQVDVNPLNPLPDLDGLLRDSPSDFKSVQAISAFRSVGVDLPEYLWGE